MVSRLLSIGLIGTSLLAAAPSVAQSHPPASATDSYWLEDLGLDRYEQRRGRPQAGKALNGGPIRMGGVVHAHGVGSLSIAEFVLDLRGEAKGFEAVVGLDDSAIDAKREGTVRFQVWADERLVADTGVIRVGDPPQRIDVALDGARTLTLRLDDGGDTSNGDRANWADARIVMKPGARPPAPYERPQAPMPQIAMPDESRVALHGPLVVGTTPGKPFLHRIGATGPQPIRIAADGLPPGLSLDPETGIISGVVAKAGRYDVRLRASGRAGTAERRLRIVAQADALALTPPMGWNSWNVWGTAVDDAKVRAAADALVSSGLAAYGFDTVVIDDAWTDGRNPDGSIKPNAKFPDMKALADYIHARGLKFGIYSSPGPKTCGGYQGSYDHEAQDATTFAAWGVDFLKYDWCSYDDVAKDRSLAELQKPYAIMGQALQAQARDIVFSLCQYGYGEVWKWGGDVGGQLWRTTGDLLDNWSNLDSVGFRQAGRGKYVRPGRWNDTDMLVLGTLGWGPDLRTTRLTHDEQLLHMTLWAMQAAPLFIGADLTKLDPFTLALLKNDEVLDITRDPDAHAGERVWAKDRLEVWSRRLADGSIAVALFNRGLEARPVAASWADLGLSGAHIVRDVWQARDLGRFSDGYTATVPSHGAMLLLIRPSGPDSVRPSP